MAAGLVDRLQVTLFPVIAGQTGLDPVFGGAADFLHFVRHHDPGVLAIKIPRSA